MNWDNIEFIKSVCKIWYRYSEASLWYIHLKYTDWNFRKFIMRFFFCRVYVKETFEDHKEVILRWTYNKTDKRKGLKGQTTIYKILLRKLKIKQYKPTLNTVGKLMSFRRVGRKFLVYIWHPSNYSATTHWATRTLTIKRPKEKG